MPTKRKSYHFSTGNSNTGKMGMCARVYADTREEACERLNKVLTSQGELDITNQLVSSGIQDIEYVCLYFNGTRVVTPSDIDEVDENV